MNITIIGAGYVGLVASACFASKGHTVTCVDHDEVKIHLLQQNKIPIYESHLDSLLKTFPVQFQTSLSTLSIKQDVIMIAVGTRDVLDVALAIGNFLTGECVIVNKSTVPVGTTEKIQEIIALQLKNRGLNFSFDVVSNPEFLREGHAIADFLHPDRIILGLSSEGAKLVMLALYASFVHPDKIYIMNTKDAEMTKYATNAMLAARISFINEMANLCDEVGVDIENVCLGLGADSRIGNLFLDPGCGYGGSCFPKDVKALIQMAEKKGVEPCVLKAIERRNEIQKCILVNKIIQYFGENLSGLTFGVWGLSFKPETDDMREASSLTLLKNLLDRKAEVQAFDPIAMSKAKSFLPKDWFQSKRFHLVADPYDALQAADALVLVTEWEIFSTLNFDKMKNHMRRHVIFDGRNYYNPEQCRRANFIYHGIGRGTLN